MADPKYIRLCDRLTNGMLADTMGGSGWSISGLDVKPFPIDELQARFVRANVNNGKLERASLSEYEEAHEDDNFLEQAGITLKPVELEGSFQEGKVLEAAAVGHRAVKASRGLGGAPLDYEADERRRAKMVEQQDRYEDSDDDFDEEDFDEDTGTNPSARAEFGGDAAKAGNYPLEPGGRDQLADQTPDEIRGRRKKPATKRGKAKAESEDEAESEE